MRGLPAVETGPATRVRRWDVIVLGGALPGLVAAARLGMEGARVLLLEEAGAAERPACLREPFYLGGSDRHSPLGACLRALRVPLIDQKRITHDPRAFQVLLPDARIDIGEPSISVDEWVTWGLAKPGLAERLAAGLRETGLAERDALLDEAVVSVRGSRRKSTRSPEGSDGPPRSRGLPAGLDAAPEALRRVLGAWTRALSGLAESDLSPQARAFLLGAPLAGAAEPGPAGALAAILRRRIESVYGEFRSLPENFRLISSGGYPGVAPDADGSSAEVWVGRALVLNAPREALAASVAQAPPPEVLECPTAARRRVRVHWRVAAELVPEALARRAVILGSAGESAEGTDLVTLRRWSPEGGRVDLVATARVRADADEERVAAAIERCVAALLPFAEDGLARVETPAARWDDDLLLPEPPPNGGWPQTTELRLPGRQHVYALDRARVAVLGSDGDVLLGWRAGDAIAADLK